MDDRFKRSKLVNFRVSEEEFAQIKEAAQASESRSVSVFAREAVLGPQRGAASTGCSDVESHFAHINQKLEAIITILAPLTSASDDRDEVKAFAASVGAIQTVPFWPPIGLLATTRGDAFLD